MAAALCGQPRGGISRVFKEESERRGRTTYGEARRKLNALISPGFWKGNRRRDFRPEEDDDDVSDDVIQVISFSVLFIEFISFDLNVQMMSN